MQLNIEPGVLGAKRQSWASYNPRDLLKRVMKNNPRASEAECFNKFVEILEKNPKHFPAMVEYWFANNYRALHVEEPAPNSIVVRERHQCRTSPEREVRQVKERLQAALMDHVLANGVALRNATFGDCAKEGGWLTRISKHGKAGEVVGKKLTDKDLVNLMKQGGP